MAADHRRKRLNSASISGCSSWEQYRNKKKKIESPKSYSNLKSCIFLEWDGKQQKVIAKGEQIGLSKRDLRPFINSVPQSHNYLADVFTVPPDIFDLENLKEVLSYEVWKTCLLEDERNFLMQFLPKGLDSDEVVKALLDGDNFHFGNPFLEWGDSVCLGNSHPDAVIFQEQHLKVGKKAYYAEIQKYHNDMIEYLQNLKKSWESNKDPEKDVLQKIWRSRSRRNEEKRTSSLAKVSRFHDFEENVAATSESSLVVEEKACSSDNDNSLVIKGGERQKRINEKKLSKGKSKKSIVSSHDARSIQGDKLFKHNVYHSDGAEYMSYLKISKKQHQLVMSMKQSGKGIQSKSLNRVLGNLDDLHVQPYEEFVKEEQKKLQQHWSKLANEDLPAAYASWRERQLQMQEMIKSLKHDMKGKLMSLVEDEDKENHGTLFLDQNDPGANEYESDEEDEENENRETLLQDQNGQGRNEYESNEEDEEDENQETLLQDENDDGAHEFDSNEEDEENNNHDTLFQNQNDSGTNEYESNEEDDETENHESLLQDQNNGGANGYESIEEDEENVKDEALLQDQNDQGANEYESIEEDEESEDHETLLQDQYDQGANEYESIEEDDNENLETLIKDQNDQGASDQKLNTEEDENSGSGCLDNHSPQKISSDGRQDLDSIYMDSENNNVPSKPSDTSPNILEYSGDANTADVPISQGIPLSSGGGVWSADSVPLSYYDSAAKNEYTSTSGPSLPHQANEEQNTHLINLESDVHEEDMGKGLLHRQSDGSFSSYPNHDRSGLLQSLFKGQRILSYHHEQKQSRIGYHREQKQPGLNFQSPSNILMDGGQFTGHLGQLQPSLPLGQGQKRQSEDYIQQNISEDIYTEGGGYLIPNRGHLPPVGVQNWTVNHVRLASQLQPHLNNDGLPQNWFSGEHQVRAGWTSSGPASVPSQSIGSNADQSLFSVLSQCNQLCANGPFDTMGTNEQFMLPRNYGTLSGGNPRMSNSLTQVAHPLDYMNGRETGTSVMPDDMGWVNLPQNSALHDVTGKPFSRSWNQ